MLRVDFGVGGGGLCFVESLACAYYAHEVRRTHPSEHFGILTWDCQIISLPGNDVLSSTARLYLEPIYSGVAP